MSAILKAAPPNYSVNDLLWSILMQTNLINDMSVTVKVAPPNYSVNDLLWSLLAGGGISTTTTPPGSVGPGNTVISAATGYTGGGSTKLDGESTTAVDVPTIYCFKHSTSGWRQYLLRAGTDAEASPNIIRPDDYAASTNEKVFELMF